MSWCLKAITKWSNSKINFLILKMYISKFESLDQVKELLKWCILKWLFVIAEYAIFFNNFFIFQILIPVEFLCVNTLILKVFSIQLWIKKQKKMDILALVGNQSTMGIFQPSHSWIRKRHDHLSIHHAWHLRKEGIEEKKLLNYILKQDNFIF